MTQEDKDLLLKDLSSRLPYNTKVLCKYYHDDFGKENVMETIFILNEIDTRILTNPYWIGGNQLQENGFSCGITDFAICIDDEDTFIKPYLRRLSSITEKEICELMKFGAVVRLENEEVLDVSCVGFDKHAVVQDWLNAHYFDYRGLIDKELALVAPEDMYN